MKASTSPQKSMIIFLENFYMLHNNQGIADVKGKQYYTFKRVPNSSKPFKPQRVFV